MDSKIYVERRQRLMRELSDGLILVRGVGSEGVNPNFLYLTGLSEPGATLLLAARGVRVGTGRANPGPDYVRGREAHQVLFLPAGDPLAARWGEDSVATVGSVSAADTGVDAIYPVAELASVLVPALNATPTVHLVRGIPAALGTDRDADAELADRLRSRFFDVQVRDGARVVHEMRRSKDPTEVAAIRRAIDVTAQALQALVRQLRDGTSEHVLEAEIAHVYRAHRGTHAFDPIVGCGENALKLHYTANSGTVRAGELLLVDTGVSIEGYKSDITRTFPVNGRYTARQREVYDVVLQAQKKAIASCVAGTTLGEVHARAFEVIDAAGFGEYLPHGIGHHLGLETHDVGDVHLPLQPGAVVTIEPGIYIPDESIGIRIEDDVLVTADGPEVLSAAIPKEADAVARWISDR